jgi:hypothetical protein
VHASEDKLVGEETTNSKPLPAPLLVAVSITVPPLADGCTVTMKLAVLEPSLTRTESGWKSVSPALTSPTATSPAAFGRATVHVVLAPGASDVASQMSDEMVRESIEWRPGPPFRVMVVLAESPL